MFEIKFKECWERKMMDENQLTQEALFDEEKNLKEWVHSFIVNLAVPNYCKVIFYKYRTASVSDEIFDADRESMMLLEYMLAIKAGVKPDNHTCYEVEFGRQKFYFWCTDELFRVGKKKFPW